MRTVGEYFKVIVPCKLTFHNQAQFATSLANQFSHSNKLNLKHEAKIIEDPPCDSTKHKCLRGRKRGFEIVYFFRDEANPLNWGGTMDLYSLDCTGNYSLHLITWSCSAPDLIGFHMTQASATGCPHCILSSPHLEPGKEMDYTVSCRASLQNWIKLWKNGFATVICWGTVHHAKVLCVHVALIYLLTMRGVSSSQS